MDIGKIQASIGGLEKELKAFGEIESPTDEQVTEVESKVSELEKLQANLQAAEANAKADQLNEKISALLANQNTGGQLEPVAPVSNGPKVPATAKPRHSLKAFGNDHESLEAAYVSGRSIAAGLFGHSKSKQWLGDHGIQNTTLYEGEDQKGGIFVPTEMELAIIRLVESYGVFRRFAKSVPMNSDRKVVPVRTGGLTAYAIGETTPSNESSNSGTRTSPTYNPIELIARKWKAWLKMSDEVNEDAMIQLADEVAREMALAFSYAEDNAGFNGDGSSTYNGVTGALNVLAAGSKYT
jgi:HK97 family phage major capsid protein